MVEDECEQILDDWNTVDENCTSEVTLAALTARLADVLRGLRIHVPQDEEETRWFLEKLLNSSAVLKLVNLLQVTRNHRIQGDALSIFEILSTYKKGSPLSSVCPTLLWLVLMELAIEFGAAVLTDHRYLALETLTRFFKNKTNALKICQTTESVQLILDALKLLESKEGSRKLVLKRHKSAAVILSSISRHKEGRQLIIEANVVERLHAFLLTLQNEKSRDSIVHKIGQTILRCIPLRDLYGISGAHSAFSYPPFAAFVELGSQGSVESSDSSEASDSEEEIQNVLSIKKEKKKSLPALPVNPYRSVEELEQYRRHFTRLSNDTDYLTNICQEIDENCSRSEIYEFFAQRTRSINGSRLIPCPDWINASGSSVKETFYLKDRVVCRAKLMKTLKMVLNPNLHQPVVVYDLDSTLLDSEQTRFVRMVDFDGLSDHPGKAETPLEFESRFESGNLRRAMRIGAHEYDLVLNPDVNSTSRQQWFYFRISGVGVCSSTTYTFNIINLEKQRTLFNLGLFELGMQPVIFSVKHYLATGQPVWERQGTSICYYRNGFRKSTGDLSYWSLSFDLTLPYDNDVVYVAYHYPYTYSQLMTDIITWQRGLTNNERLRISTLCHSPCGNPIPLLLIDDYGDTKSCCVFMSRVHPCESNSSWSMRGLINTALQDAPQSDEKQHPLVILPMLNVDGTVHGCSRTELSNEDLNRRWLQPDLNRHPTIYHAKGLLEFICRVLNSTPAVLCDMHGHSRRFNTFVYGCKASQSWNPRDHPSLTKASDLYSNDATSLPFFVQVLLSELPLLDVDQCSFQVEKSREGTARIVGWRHMGIKNAYTLESSLAGSDQHLMQELQQFSTASYLQVGEAWVKVIRRI